MSAATPPEASARPRALLLAVLLFTAGPAFAAETFTYSADSANLAPAQSAQHALLSGHARLSTQDLRITADRMELFGKDFIYAQCSGNVHVVDARRGLDLRSDQLFYDRERKIARVTGNAVMADVKNQIVARAGFIEDRDTEQLTIIQIGVRIFRRDIECKAEFARYYRDKKVLELSGMPWVSKGNDVYVGSRITINLDTEEISAEGGVSGTVQEQGGSTGQGTEGTPQGQPAPQDQGNPAGQPAPQDQGSPAGQPAPPDNGATQGQGTSSGGSAGGQ